MSPRNKQELYFNIFLSIVIIFLFSLKYSVSGIQIFVCCSLLIIPIVGFYIYNNFNLDYAYILNKIVLTVVIAGVLVSLFLWNINIPKEDFDILCSISLLLGIWLLFCYKELNNNNNNKSQSIFFPPNEWVHDEPSTDFMKREDQQGRKRFVENLCDNIKSSRNEYHSSVITVNAKWGEGKSSIIKASKENLVNYNNSILIEINPWLFSDTELLITNFFHDLGTELKSNSLNKMTRLGNEIIRYGQLFIPHEPLYKASSSLLTQIFNSLNNASIESKKQHLNGLLLKKQKHIIVFIDDIDRLDHNEVSIIIKTVKLIGDFPNVTYVLAYDREYIEYSLAHTFGSENVITGRRYLEKIVHLNKPLPPLSQQELRSQLEYYKNKIIQHYGKQNEWNDDYWFQFSQSLYLLASNPREIKRIANSVYNSYSLYDKYIRLEDFIVLKSIEEFVPEITDALRNNIRLLFPALLTTAELEQALFVHLLSKKEKDPERETLLDNILANIDIREDKKQSILELIKKLFPSLSPDGFDKRDASNYALPNPISEWQTLYFYFYGEFSSDFISPEKTDNLTKLLLEEEFEVLWQKLDGLYRPEYLTWLKTMNEPSKIIANVESSKHYQNSSHFLLIFVTLLLMEIHSKAAEGYLDRTIGGSNQEPYQEESLIYELIPKISEGPKTLKELQEFKLICEKFDLYNIHANNLYLSGLFYYFNTFQDEIKDEIKDYIFSEFRKSIEDTFIDNYYEDIPKINHFLKWIHRNNILFYSTGNAYNNKDFDYVESIIHNDITLLILLNYHTEFSINEEFSYDKDRKYARMKSYQHYFQLSVLKKRLEEIKKNMDTNDDIKNIVINDWQLLEVFEIYYGYLIENDEDYHYT